MKVNAKEPLKPRVTFGKFQNIDIRVAEIVTAEVAKGTQKPCRVITLDAGHLGKFTTVGQYALIPEAELIGRKVVIVCNLSPRQMGPYTSDVLLIGAPHPDSPIDEEQAIPVYLDDIAVCGDQIF